MKEKEKEKLLYRMDEKVDSLDGKVESLQHDVRGNRDIFNDRLRKESKKIDETEDIARGNRIRLAGVGSVLVLLLSIAAKNAGILTI